MIGAEPVQVGAVLPAQMEEVLEPCGRDERRARALALEQRVRRHRRAVRETLDLHGADRTRRSNDRLLLTRAVGTFAVRSSSPRAARHR